MKNFPTFKGLARSFPSSPSRSPSVFLTGDQVHMLYKGKSQMLGSPPPFFLGLFYPKLSVLECISGVPIHIYTPSTFLVPCLGVRECL